MGPIAIYEGFMGVLWGLGGPYGGPIAIYGGLMGVLCGLGGPYGGPMGSEWN